MPKFKLIAKTLSGLEKILAKELASIGATDICEQNRAVSFLADKALLYRANLHLRTALRVLKPIAVISVNSENELYNSVQQTDWSAFLNLDKTFAVDSFVFSKFFTHSKYVSLKVKDAIVDQFRQRTGRRPSVDRVDPDLRLNVHITDTQCTIALDSSGDSLHKRGYRLDKTEAPLNEVLAAGLILSTGWNGQSHYVDPMCGSGTLLIEAALLAYNIPPGFYRDKFGFMQWDDFDPKLWQDIRKEAERNFSEFNYEIVGSDKSGKAIIIARQNIARAQMQNKIVVKQMEFEKCVAPGGEGIVVFNPPYGERMQEQGIIDLYKTIGDRLKQHFAGYDAWILSSNKEALKHIGLRPSRKLTFFNGPLECRFQYYDLYKGSKKAKYQMR